MAKHSHGKTIQLYFDYCYMCMRMHREFLNFGNNVFVDSSKPLAHTYPKKICYKEPCTIRTLFSWLATRYNLWVKFKLQCIWLSVKKCSCILIQKKIPIRKIAFWGLKDVWSKTCSPWPKISNLWGLEIRRYENFVKLRNVVRRFLKL